MAKTREANARPTKELFVSVLGRDISLVAAIIDLVDNSIDGARRLRKPPASLTDTKSFNGLWIKIEAKPKYFRIRDNCGGISVNVASRYAFRFGRPPDAPKSEIPEYATGQFGVGMKRALFKLGTHFKIESTTKSSRFEVEVDVKEWLKLEEDDWHFDMKDVEEKVEVHKTEIGTDIHVDNLHKTIAEDFSDDTMIGKLREELHQRHMLSLHRGLKIELNDSEIEVQPPAILATKAIVPAYQRTYLKGGKPIRVEILCGVNSGSSSGYSREAGWSVFLNDRMVLSKDKTNVTGWGDKDEKRIPGYHNQYGRFRGYAFLNCPDTSRLPWDTTKTGLDKDKPEYRLVKGQLIALMEPVVRFLDDVDKETTHLRVTGEEGPLLEALGKADKGLFEIVVDLPQSRPKEIERPFKRPPRKIVKEPVPTDQTIQFSRPKDQIAVLKDFFEVSSGKAAGESAWDWVLEVEDL